MSNILLAAEGARRVIEMNVGDIITLFSVLIAAALMVHTFMKDSKSDKTNEINRINSVTESLIKLNVKLDQICTTTSETRADIKAMDRKIGDQERRIVILEKEFEELKKDVETLIEKDK